MIIYRYKQITKSHSIAITWALGRNEALYMFYSNQAKRIDIIRDV